MWIDRRPDKDRGERIPSGYGEINSPSRYRIYGCNFSFMKNWNFSLAKRGGPYMTPYVRFLSVNPVLQTETGHSLKLFGVVGNKNQPL